MPGHVLDASDDSQARVACVVHRFWCRDGEGTRGLGFRGLSRNLLVRWLGELLAEDPKMRCSRKENPRMEIEGMQCRSGSTRRWSRTIT